MRKAELAVSKDQDDLARAAIERSMSYRQMAESFTQQVADQKLQVENLKNALHKLEQKLIEAQAKSDLLVAQHRRSRALRKAGEAEMVMGTDTASNTFDRMKNKVMHAEALSKAVTEMNSGNMDDRLAALEKEDRIEALLAGLKARRKSEPAHGS
jgi:phage shock protein A